MTKDVVCSSIGVDVAATGYAPNVADKSEKGRSDLLRVGTSIAVKLL